MHPKDADGMASSVDPDQTASSEAVWSWSALFAETYLSQYIEFVRYITPGPETVIPFSITYLDLITTGPNHWIGQGCAGRA